MKRTLLIGLVTLSMLSACGRSSSRDDIIDFEAVIEAQLLEIYKLQIAGEEAHNRIQNFLSEQIELESRILRLESDLLREQQPPSARFWHGTEDSVRESLLCFFDNSGIADELQEILGLTFSSADFGEILISNHYVLVGVANWWGIHFLFNYIVDHEKNITWRIIGYDVYWLNLSLLTEYLIPPETPRFTVIRPLATPRSLTNENYVTVRFYRFPDESPYYRPHQYTEEIIAGENLWEEAIRLSGEHGFLVRDLWYEENTLFVDLKLAMNFAFRVGWGSTVWAMAMVETFYSFPGVSEVVFLLDGDEMPLVYNHFSINNPRGFHFQ
jgi:hypothetical protein